MVKSKESTTLARKSVSRASQPAAETLLTPDKVGCGGVAAGHVAAQVALLARPVYQLELLAGFIRQGDFDGQAQAIRHGQERARAPGMAPVEVVVGNGALVKGVCKRGIQGQRRTR